ncbi:MAG TPA: DUF1476 domain-containing protein [Methylovirgula sp.]|nr:DUF1476 domain-containing protein [Methylovirgula sp.]
MTTFDEREKAYEAMLAHDEELKFKANVRRSKWLGLWAAEKLGKEGKAAADYANSLVAAQLEGDGEQAVLRKVRADFDAAGVPVSDHLIEREMAELLAKATKEVIAGTKTS